MDIIGMHIVEAREHVYWNQGGKELVSLTGNPNRDPHKRGQVECLIDERCRVKTVLTPYLAAI